MGKVYSEKKVYAISKKVCKPVLSYFFQSFCISLQFLSIPCLLSVESQEGLIVHETALI